MKKFSYLYGENDPKILHQMNYIEALWQKIHWSKELVDELQDIHWSIRPMARLSESLASQKHNRALIFEYKEEL